LGFVCKENKFDNRTAGGGGMTKYHARKVKADGYTFDSQAEYARFRILRLLADAGEIEGLKVHPRYVLLDPFTCKGVKYRGISYEADFEYLENGKRVTEDVKGFRTQTFNLKEKLFINRYGNELEFRIVEVK
jgi:hypothetical protein